MKRYLKFVLFIFLLCLIGTGSFFFANNWKGDGSPKESGDQTVPALKLFNSHSSPQTRENWVVSFETKGRADLIITPKDRETIGDLEFVSLVCDSGKELEMGSPQILDGDIIFFPDWQCVGRGELTHLIKIARKHVLSFQFGGELAFAYNNPDSVTDTFTDESKIATKSNITVSGGQVKLSTCSNNGTACSSPGECCSGYCVDGVCCDSACSGSTCQTCGQYSSNGTGSCGYVNDSGQDPDSECGTTGCYTGNCSGSAYACGYHTSGEQNCTTACTTCNGATSGSCVNVANNTQDTEGSYTCSVTCEACQSGACDNADNDTDPGDQCSPVANCTEYIYGWSGNDCVKYSGGSSHNGMCNGSGACYTTVADSCSGAGATSATCGSSDCKKACVANSYYTDYDTTAEVCYVSTNTAACPDVTCTTLVKGWSSNDCQRYTSNSTGYCDSSGTCDTTADTTLCDAVSGQTGTTMASCGSSACKEACPAGGATSSYDEVSEICYTSGQRSCSTCYGCNASGACAAQTTSCGAGTYGCAATACNLYGTGCCTSPNYYKQSGQKCSSGTCTISGCSCNSAGPACGICPF